MVGMRTKFKTKQLCGFQTIGDLISKETVFCLGEKVKH